MAFDPTKNDAERMHDTVSEKFDDAWVELFRPHGTLTLKAEPPEGDDAKARATEIDDFLRDKGLRTQRNKLNDDGTLYEVTATTDAWGDL